MIGLKDGNIGRYSLKDSPYALGHNRLNLQGQIQEAEQLSILL